MKSDDPASIRIPGKSRASRDASTRRLSALSLSAPAAERDEAEDWMLSFMDMATMLMVMFLTLVGLLWIDKKTRPTVVNVLQIESGLPRGFRDAIPIAAETHPAVPEQPLPDYVHIEGQTRATIDFWLDALRRHGLDDQVQLQVFENRVSIAIRDQLLFPSGSNAIQPAGISVLRRLARLLQTLPGVVSVEGHTDDVPIRSDRFPSNWELSAGRAAAVVRALIEHGLQPQRLRATGYAETRPAAHNDSADGRARNRRVTLVVEDWR